MEWILVQEGIFFYVGFILLQLIWTLLTEKQFVCFIASYVITLQSSMIDTVLLPIIAGSKFCHHQCYIFLILVRIIYLQRLNFVDLFQSCSLKIVVPY